MPARIRKEVRSTTLERLRQTQEADRRVAGRPQPLQLGEGLNYLLEHIEVPVDPGDLLLGRILEEVPDEEGEGFFQAALRGWNGRPIPAWMGDGGHECFAWERLLVLGLPGLEEAARRELGRRAAAGQSQEVLDFLRGAVRVYQAFRTYARRYSRRAWEAGLPAVACTCAAIAERPPECFAQGLQLIWLVGQVYCTMLAVNPTLTFGRRAGQPLSENTSPYPGSSRNGLTAMLRSLARLPLDRIHSGGPQPAPAALAGGRRGGAGHPVGPAGRLLRDGRSADPVVGG